MNLFVGQIRSENSSDIENVLLSAGYATVAQIKVGAPTYRHDVDGKRYSIRSFTALVSI